MARRPRWVVRDCKAKHGKWLWDVSHLESSGWYWEQKDRKTFGVVAEGRCKRKSDALRRCRKRAGVELKWEPTTWTLREGRVYGWIQRKNVRLNGKWRYVWDFLVDICDNNASKGFWDLRYAVKLWGRAKSERGAKSAVEKIIKQTLAKVDGVFDLRW